MSLDERPTLAAPDDDPHLWLEDIEGERALDFVTQQNQRTLDKFGGPRFERDRDTLTEIFDRPDNIPYVTRRGGFLYNLWKDASHPRGLWRRTTLDEFRKTDPAWEMLLDVDRLATDENEDWLLSWTQMRPGSGARAILSLSRGGSDAATLREFDVDAKAFVTDGFVLPAAKGGADWVDADTLMLSSSYGDGMATHSGYARTVRLWRRGTDVGDAMVVFETTADHMRVYCGIDDTGSAPRAWFIDQTDFFNLAISLGDETGAKSKLDLPTNVWVQADRNWLAVKLRETWTVEDRTYAADTVLGISLSAFMAGSRQFAVAFEPGPRRALQGLFWAGGKLVLPILDELHPMFEVCTPSATAWSKQRLSGLPEIGVVDVWPLDRHESESNGDLLANVQDPLTPPSLMLIEGAASPALLKQAPRTFNTNGLVVTQHEAISVDGERIPYVQTGPATETGDAPVHMTAYGGFGHSVKPYYKFGPRQAVAGTGRHLRSSQHPWRRRVRNALARCRPLCRQATGA